MKPLAEGETMLMAAGCWQLRSTNPKAKSWNDDLESYIYHECPGGTFDNDSGVIQRFWWNATTIDTPCRVCEKYPPKDMLGLWKLHNYEWFQQEIR